MGKRNKESNMTETNETTETGEANTEPKTNSRAIFLALEDGTTVKRVDYIRRRADEGATRSVIAKELTELQGKKVAYQIVFAATKDHPAYPKKCDAGTADTADTAETVEDTQEIAA